VIDGEESQDDFLFTIACNTKHTGRGMKMAPKSELNDGLIDLVLVRDAGRLKLLQMFPKVFDGSHIEDPIVEYHQVRSFSVTPTEDEILNLDGELKGSTPFSVTVLPSSFSVFA
jgi:diacylglycerol kinase family enzyme